MWSLAKYILLSKLLMHLPVGKLSADKESVPKCYIQQHIQNKVPFFSQCQKAPQAEKGGMNRSLFPLHRLLRRQVNSACFLLLPEE